MKINKIPEFYTIFARKINKISECYTTFARKMPEYYTTHCMFTLKYFPGFFGVGGGGWEPFAFLSYAYGWAPGLLPAKSAPDMCNSDWVWQLKWIFKMAPAAVLKFVGSEIRRQRKSRQQISISELNVVNIS